MECAPKVTLATRYAKSLCRRSSSLREPDPRRRDEKRPFPLRTKNYQHNPNNRLTGKAPYKFESISLQRRVLCEPGFADDFRTPPRVIGGRVDDRASEIDVSPDAARGRAVRTRALR